MQYRTVFAAGATLRLGELDGWERLIGLYLPSLASTIRRARCLPHWPAIPAAATY